MDCVTRRTMRNDAYLYPDSFKYSLHQHCGIWQELGCDALAHPGASQSLQILCLLRLARVRDIGEDIINVHSDPGGGVVIANSRWLCLLDVQLCSL